MSDELMVPLDDGALNAIEHALNGVVHVDDDGRWHREGAEYGLDQLLQFWSGHDPDDSYHGGYIDGIPVYVANKPRLSEHDLIRALVEEIRVLREVPRG
jgi:hypothetical protein